MRTEGLFYWAQLSPDLIRKRADSLAGRIGYLELTPFFLGEIEVEEMEKLWIRGGFPLSFRAKSERESQLWRQNFIKTYRAQSLRTYNLYMVNLVCLDHSFYQVIEHSSFALRSVEAITEFI